MLAEVHDEVAGLLRGPGPVGMPGHAQDMEVAVADLECEQDVEPPQCHRAVDMEEVDRQNAAGLGVRGRIRRRPVLGGLINHYKAAA